MVISSFYLKALDNVYLFLSILHPRSDVKVLSSV